MSVLIFRTSTFAALLLSLACASACSSGTSDRASAVDSAAQAQATRAVAPADTDHFGAPLRADSLSSARIVSLNPMATEVLYAIGASERLVGRSAWDEYPAEVKSVPSVGDGIRPNVEAVLAVKPTLVIMYATAENRAAADAFARAGVRTMALRVDHISEFMSFTQRLGVAVGREQRATMVRDSVQRTLDLVRAAMAGAPLRTVVWPVWMSPVMVIGGGSFLDELVAIAGGRNVFHESESPSPQVSIEEVARRNPDFVIANPKTQVSINALPAWKSVNAVRNGKFITDDPSITGRPSVVLGMAAVSLARAMHPELAHRLPR